MKKQLLLTRMLLLVALLVGSVSVWATVPDNPKWVATAIGSISDNATVIILSNSNIALPSTTSTSANPAKKTCTVSTTAGVTTITPPAGTTIQDLAWTFKKVVENNNTYYKFYQEGSSTIRLYLSGTSSNTALRVGDANSTNDKFVMGSGGKLLKVSTASRYVGPYSGGSDWRTYSTETADNYGGATLTFYVLRAAVETHKLTFSATNGSITAKDAGDATVVTNSDVEEGANLTITAVPAAGYKFVQWSKTGEGASIENTTANPTTFTMGTADATLTAEFEKDNTEYTITIDPSIENGSVDASASKALLGTEITLTPSADSGCRFVSWNVTDAESNTITVTNNKFNMPGSNVTVSATFAKEYDITITPSENGEVTSDVAKAISGETVTLTITPATNYSLNTISVKDADEGDVALSGTGNTRTFTMPAKAVTVNATFHMPKGSLGNPYSVTDVEKTSGSLTNKYVTGYVVGYAENSKHFPYGNNAANSNLTLADSPDISININGTPTSSNSDGLIAIKLTNQFQTNYGLGYNNGALIGEKIIVKGEINDYFTGRGVKTTNVVITDKSYTTSEAISSTSSIPNYSEDTNTIYYVGSGSTITGASNVVKETTAGVCTADEIKITEGIALNIPTDITASKITNSRTLAADEEDAYTWYEPYAYTLPDGNVAYTFTGASGTTLTFTETGSPTLAANTPYLIVAKNAVNGSVNSSTVVKATPTTNTSGGTQGNWQFVGTYKTMTATEAEAANMWALGAGNKWYYYTGSDTYGVYPRRAYMINSADKANEAKQFDTTFGEAANEATHIELVNKQNPDESRIYTLDGKYVGTKKEVLNGGIYVKDGKKFIIK